MLRGRFVIMGVRQRPFMLGRITCPRIASPVALWRMVKYLFVIQEQMNLTSRVRKGNMDKINRLLNVVLWLGGLLLAASYFLPVEADWSPLRISWGYCIGGKFVQGPVVMITETAPYAAAAIILLMVSLARWNKVCVAIAVGTFAVWISSLAIYVIRLVALPLIEFPQLWKGLALVLLPIIATIVLLVAKRFNKPTAVLSLVSILAVSSILQQESTIAIFLLEDNLLLNIGSVTGVAGAVSMLIALLVRRALVAATLPQASNSSEA